MGEEVGREEAIHRTGSVDLDFSLEEERKPAVPLSGKELKN